MCFQTFMSSRSYVTVEIDMHSTGILYAPSHLDIACLIGHEINPLSTLNQDGNNTTARQEATLLLTITITKYLCTLSVIINPYPSYRPYSTQHATCAPILQRKDRSQTYGTRAAINTVPCLQVHLSCSEIVRWNSGIIHLVWYLDIFISVGVRWNGFVCMCMCVSLWVCVSLSVCLCVCMCFVCLCVWVYVWLCVCVFVSACFVCVIVSVCVSLCMYMYCECGCVCVSACTSPQSYRFCTYVHWQNGNTDGQKKLYRIANGVAHT